MELSYKIAPKLPFVSRLALSLFLALLGIVLQFTVHAFPGHILILAAGILFAASNFSNKPKDLGLEDWRPVTDRELDRIADNLRQSKKIKLPPYFSSGTAIFFFVLCIVLTFLGFMFDSPSMSQFWFNCLCFIGPVLVSGSVNVWIPAELKMKMECFQAVLSQERAEGLVITPYLRFDKDKEGKEIPEDVRLMLEHKRMANDFVGIQLQAAINNGEHGNVPYLYAVCLTRGKGPSFKKLSGMQIEGFEIEWKEPDEYGAVVVRQQTGGGGYHTTTSDCARLFKLCAKIFSFATE